MLKDWKIWQKLTAIAVAMGVMLPVLLYLAVTSRNQDIEFARQEGIGARYLKGLVAIYAKVPEHRGRTNALLSGDAAQAASVAPLAAAIDAEFETLATLDREFGSALGTKETVASLRADWNALRQGGSRMTPARAFEAHTRLIDRLATAIEDVGDSSNIRLDPIRDSYYLGELVLLWGPRSIEDRGQLRGRTAGIVARGRVTPEEQAELSLLIGAIRSSNRPIARAVRLVAEDNPDFAATFDALLKSSEAKAEGLVQLVQGRVLEGGVPTASVQDVFAAGNAAVDSEVALVDAALERLGFELEQRVGRLSRARNLLIAGSVLTILAAGLLVYLITALITRQVGAMSNMFQRIGIGDFQARAAVLSQDELGTTAAGINAVLDNTIALMQSREERDRIQASIMKLLEEISGLAEGDLTREAEVTADLTGAIADAFNTVTSQLRRIISDVQETTLSVSSAASEIQTTTEHLAESSETQSAQIVDTSAAVDEIALSIQQVSDNATSASGVAEQALTSARQGADVVAKTVDGMNGIRLQVQESAKRIKRLGESSQEIGEIVQLIGDIADRTSILALNASIQAAMAGEAGRGFAVVAEEVERLAVRSADATKRVSSLIRTVQSETNEAVRAMEDTTREVVAGSSLANSAGQALAEIQAVAGRLAELIQSITMAAKQQARGSDSVAKAMGDISDNTQQTAAGTKQVAVSIRNLAELADNLRDSVAAFRLPARRS